MAILTTLRKINRHLTHPQYLQPLLSRMDFLPEQVKFYARWDVVLCTQCQHGIRSKHLVAHFAHSHRLSKPGQVALQAFVRECIEEISRLDQAPQLPETLARVLDGFPTRHHLVRCTLEPAGCNYVCSTSHDMRRHCREQHHWVEHGRRGRPSASSCGSVMPWQKTTAQRLLQTGPGSCWIPIQPTSSKPGGTPPEIPSTSRDLLSHIEDCFQRVHQTSLERIVDEPRGN